MLILAQVVQFAPVMLKREVGEAGQLGRVRITVAPRSSSSRRIFKPIVGIGWVCAVGTTGGVILELSLWLHLISHIWLQAVLIEMRLERRQTRRRGCVGEAHVGSERRSIGLESSLLTLGPRDSRMIMLRRTIGLATSSRMEGFRGGCRRGHSIVKVAIPGRWQVVGRVGRLEGSRTVGMVIGAITSMMGVCLD